MKPIRQFIYLLSVVCICVTAVAQGGFVTKISTSKMGKNQTLEVSYEAHDGGIENFQAPAFNGWRIAGGPNVSSSTIVTNGKTASSMSYQYVLMPAKTGRLTVPGARATINGKEYSSNTVSVEVKEQDVPGASASTSNAFDPFQLTPDMGLADEEQTDNDGFFLLPGEDADKKTRANLYAVVEVSKKTCYPGEAIRASYKLYSRVNMEAHITKRPSFSGFSSIDVPDDVAGESSLVKLKGKVYRVYPIRTVQLYPLQAGQQTLQPVEIDATVQYRKINDTQVYQYDPFAASTSISHPFVVKSEPVVINVLPFPEEAKPADFNGVTGNFTIESSADYPDLAKKEAGILKVTIAGSGNWAMLQQPDIKWPQGVDVFEPAITEKLDSQAMPVTGVRTYSFPFSGNKAGNITIPGVSFTYFDPIKKQYASATSPSVNVDIKNKLEPLHRTAPVIVTSHYTDGTEMFTTIVKVVFPIAALLLAGWFIASYANRKKTRKQQAVFADNYKKATHTNAYSLEKKYANLLAVNKEATDEGRSKFAPPAADEIKVAKTTIFKPHNSFEPLTSKLYFTQLKGKLNELLMQHLNIGDQPANVTRQSLLQKGFTEQETEKITGLLQLCEQHIYSPFVEEYDAAKYDEQLLEATAILSNRK
jgi:hypothetical protein